MRGNPALLASLNVLGLAVFASCAQPSTTTSTLEEVCKPGSTRECGCTDGRPGVQYCAYDGESFSECTRCGIVLGASSTMGTGSSGIGASSRMASSRAPSSSMASSSMSAASSSVSVASSSISVASSAASSAASMGDSSSAAASTSVVVSSSTSIPSPSSSQMPACGEPPVEADPCMGVTPEAVDRTVNTRTAMGPLGITGLVTVGMTRAEVVAALSDDPEAAVMTDVFDIDPLRTNHCLHRLAISYIDTADNTGTLPRSLSDDDVVHRITFLPGFAGHTDTGIRVGNPRAFLDGQYPSDDATRVRTGMAVSGGPWDVYPSLGLSFRWQPGPSGDVIRSFAVHTVTTGTAMPNSLAAELKLNGLKIASTIAASPLTSGSTFAFVATVLGPPTMQGFTELDGGQLAVMLYSNLGIRVIARRNMALAIEQHRVNQIHLVTPYAGRDILNMRNLGLESPQAGYDAQQNMIYQGDETAGPYTVRVYRVNQGGTVPLYVAIHFTDDECGESRADYIVLDHVRM